MKLPTVEQRPISPAYVDVNVTPRSFGVGLGAGIVIAAETAGNIDAAQRLESDRQDVLKITSTGSDMLNEKTSEYTQRMLGDAKGSTSDARAEFGTIIKEALKSATNPRQARLVEDALRHQSIAHLGTVRAHEAHQFRAETERVATDMFNSSVDSVKIDPMNEETAWVAKHNAAAAVANGHPGLDEKQLTQLKAEAVSKVAASQLETLLAKGKTADFLVLYPQIVNELIGTDADRFSKYSTETADLVSVQKLTHDFYSANPGDMNAAIESARSVLSGKQEQDVVAALTSNFAQVESGKRLMQSNDINAAKAAFERGGWKVAAIPRDVYSRVVDHNFEVIASLTALETQHAAGSRASIQTDPVTWRDWNFLTRAEKLLPENDPLKYAKTWNEADYQKAVAIKAAILEEEGGFKKEPKDWNDHDLAKLLTDKFADAYKNRSGGNATRFQQYEGSVRESIKRYQSLNDGKDPKYQEIEAEIAYQLVEGRRGAPGRMWDDTGRRFQLKTGEEFAPFKAGDPVVDPLDRIDTVPASEAGPIADSLRRKGMAVTSEAILFWYKDMLDYRAKNRNPAKPAAPIPQPPLTKPSQAAPAPDRVRREP